MAIGDLILTAFGWVEHPYYDWGLSLVRGSTANTIFEAVVGQIIHIMFAGTLGIIFAYAVLLITGRNYLLKGWVFGVFVWFAVHIAVNLLGFQPLRPIPMSQLLSDFFTASVFGLVLAETLHRLSPEKVS